MIADEIRFLKESEIFKGLPESLLFRVYNQGTLRKYGPNEFICREGEQSLAMFVIRGGVVEIQKSRQPGEKPLAVAYLTVGECFGEMAMITGRSRSASVRVPQEAEVLEIPAEIYEELLQNNPIFLRRLCEVLAFRLERADVKIAGTRVGKELQGDLRYFDLATVMQTLINSGQSGIMVIESPDKVRAEVLFTAGRVLFARLGALEGEDAFYQIFQEDLSGEFIFRGEEIDPAVINAPIAKSPMNLLLEAMRMKDEVHVFLNEICDFDRVFHPSQETLAWDDNETLDTALLIWMKITEGATLDGILKEIPRCSYNTLAIIRRMLDQRLIR